MKRLMKRKLQFLQMLLCKIAVFLVAVIAVGLMVLIFSSTTNDFGDEKNFYTAAVVEYVPINASSTKETILTNLYQYEKIITRSKQSYVDIIVFPECGLTGCNYSDRNYVIENVAEIIPSPDSGVVPCRKKNSFSEVLTTLSCAALRNSMYVAVNLYEKFIEPDNQNDTNLQNKSSEILLYNTNIVFDRFGRLIARYRKFNLYVERTHIGVNSTKEPEFSFFATDFGVTFGIIICFDIIFKQPVYGLLHEKNVSAIIFSGAIYSQLPFLVVPSLVSGWAYSMNTTLLFSDMPVKNGSVGGSGIFAGMSDPLKLIMEEHYDSKVLISKVPKKLPPIPLLKNQLNKNEKSNFNSSVFIVDEKLPYYTNQSISQNLTHNSDDLLMNKFNHTTGNYTCTIQAAWTINSNTSTQSEYKFMSYAGERNFSTASINNYVEACGLTLCHKSSNGSCLEPPIFDDAFSTTMISLDIFAVSTTDAIVIPSTLDNSLYPLSVSHFMFSKSRVRTGNQESIIINMNLIKPVSNLITFGFYKLPQVSNPDPTVWYRKNETLS